MEPLPEAADDDARFFRRRRIVAAVDLLWALLGFVALGELAVRWPILQDGSLWLFALGCLPALGVHIWASSCSICGGGIKLNGRTCSKCGHEFTRSRRPGLHPS